MRLHIQYKPPARLALAALIATAVVLLPERAKPASGGKEHSVSIAGRQIFASSCASCHGLDGTGTQRAPDIAKNQEVRNLTQKQLLQIVFEGVPGAGMPAFRSLGPNGVNAVIAYLRSLQGKAGLTHLPGDAGRGETIFFGKAGCADCHMASGRGGFIAPDLTTYGQEHSAEQIRSAITNPAERDASQSIATAITLSGDRYEGVVRNEDNFSLQLQSTDGAFHVLSKSDLKSLERSPSIMPSDYSSRLSQAELDDLVSYLESIAEAAPRAEPRHRRRE